MHYCLFDRHCITFLMNGITEYFDGVFFILKDDNLLCL